MGWILLLFLAGLILIVLEFFVPGGICGTVGAIAMLVSCGMGCWTYPRYALFIILGEIIAALVGIFAGLKLIPHTPTGKAMILDSSQPPQEGWVAAQGDLSLVGQTGTVHTPLRPAGTIIINGKRYDAVSRGNFIDVGEKIQVVEVHGSRIVVKAVSGQEPEAPENSEEIKIFE